MRTLKEAIVVIIAMIFLLLLLVLIGHTWESCKGATGFWYWSVCSEIRPF